MLTPTPVVSQPTVILAPGDSVALFWAQQGLHSHANIYRVMYYSKIKSIFEKTTAFTPVIHLPFCLFWCPTLQDHEINRLFFFSTEFLTFIIRMWESLYLSMLFSWLSEVGRTINLLKSEVQSKATLVRKQTPHDLNEAMPTPTRPRPQ